MKRNLCLLAALAVLLGGCSTKPAEALPEDGQIDSGPKQILAWAEVAYENSYELTVAFPATVTEVLVKEGDEVKKGDVLLSLDMTDYNATLKALTAESTGLSREVSQLKSDIAEKSTDLSQGTKPELLLLKDTISRMEKEVADAEKELSDGRVLFEQGSMSKAEVDRLADVLAQKQKGKMDAENNLKKTENSLQAELDTLRVQLAYKEGQLMEGGTGELVQWKNKAQKDYFDGGNIICPLEGAIVQSVHVVQGTVTGGQTVVTLIDTASLRLHAEVAEDFVAQIDESMPAEIYPAAGGESLTGKIERIGAFATEKDGERIVIVTVKADDPTGVLKPGYTADVYFTAKEN